MVDRLSDLWVAAIFALTGIGIFSAGLSGAFIDDDYEQIVSNPLVHSLSNVPALLQGGTFYSANLLVGSYYRPLQSVVYAILYTVFGPTPFYFHLLQTLLVVASAFLVFKVFTNFFTRKLSFFLALLFLVHPLNSQMAFAIPKLGDALCFFFGILAFWLILRYRSDGILLAVAGCLFLAFLAKESGPVFLLVLLIYMLLFQRNRLYGWVLPIMAVPSVVYILLKAGGTGLTVAVPTAPIDYVGLGSRMLTVPSIVAFYISQFFFPRQLASAHYWLTSQATLNGFFVPLLVELFIVGLVVYAAVRLRKVSGPWFLYFLFFAAWAVLGLAPYLQIIPLDMTASETWFYSPMFGVLGMAGVVISVFGPRLPFFGRLGVKALTALVVALLLILAGRTYVRGMDWSTPFSLARSDVAAAPDNFHAEEDLTYELIQQGKYSEAVMAAQNAVAVFPSADTYQFLGAALLENQQYQQGRDTLLTALNNPILNDLQAKQQLYRALGVATLYDTNGFASDRALLLTAVNLFPNDGALWFDLAIADENIGNKAETQVAAANALSLGYIDGAVYTMVVNQVRLTFPAHPSLTGWL